MLLRNQFLDRYRNIPLVIFIFSLLQEFFFGKKQGKFFIDDIKNLA